MKRRLIAVMIAAALAVSVLGCLKRTFKLNNNKKKQEQFEKYGPMEIYGAKCGHEELDLPYAPGEPDQDFLTLDVYWSDHDGQVPVIVNIHGGGWIIGDKRDINSVYRSRFLAGRGYVVVSVNYRMLADYPIPVQVNDVMGAVVWAKENAEKYGGDPNRVGVMGGSAGGHLTAMVAWASDDPYFSPTGHADSKYDSDVITAVPFYGVYDLEQTISLDREWTKPVSYDFFTGVSDKDQQKEVLKKVSPKNYVRKNLPPTLFVCGDNDEMGLYPQSVRYSRELQDQGVPTGLVTVPGARHGFDANYGEPYTREALEKVVAWFDAYLKNAALPQASTDLGWSPISEVPGTDEPALIDDGGQEDDFELDEE